MIFDKSKYLAFVISEASKNKLFTQFPPKYEKVIAHHVTLFFSGSEKEFNDSYEKFKDVKEVEIIGYLDKNDIQCFVVEINGSYVRNDLKQFHITYSLGKDKKPVESNNILAVYDFKRILEPIKIAGKVEYVKK